MSELAGLLVRVTAAMSGAGVPFMIAGSFASSAHGLPRTTQDLDIVIDPTQDALDALVHALPPEHYYVDVDSARDALERRTMFNVIDQATGWKIDFIIRKNRVFSREEFARRIAMPLLGVPVFIASPEDTIVAKLEWSSQSGGSQRQRRDIAGILATIGAGLDRAYVERWVRDLGLDEEWAAAQAANAGELGP
jgi:hypothetical protein